jgi:hypothetical protein
LALYRSLVRHAKPFKWWVLCLDDDVFEALEALDLDRVVPIREAEILDADLARAKRSRSRREYYFTCKPWIYLYVIAAEPTAQRVTYLDGDLYYFSDPTAVDEQIAGSSVALSPHRSGNQHYESMFGVYNSGWSSFATDEVGVAALRWWRSRCIEAVPDYPVDGLFADQKYLEDLERRFDDVVPVMHNGMNLAPWNAAVSTPIEVVDGSVMAGGDPLVFFHFHGLEKRAPGLYDPGWSARGSTRLLRDEVYRPYLREVADCERVVERVLGRSTPSVAPWGGSRPRPWWWRSARTMLRVGSGLLSRRLISIRGDSLA